MLGALRRSAKEASKTLGRASQLQQQRFLNIHEYQGAELMGKHGINAPPGMPIQKIEDLLPAAKKMADSDGEVVLKSQILAGGRGLGKFKNGLQAGPMMIGCSEGGTSIEDLAEKYPEKIIKIPVDIREGITDAQANEMVEGLQVTTDKKAAAEQIKNMYEMFTSCDCTMVEVNPLAETKDGKLIAADAKLGFDDNAAFRQKELFSLRDTTQEDPRDVAASQYDLNYIGLEGSIGCMVNGAGLAMATMDIIKLHGGSPANFLDVGGNATEAQVVQAFKLLTSDKQVKALLVNIFGGIMKCDVVAQGIVNAAKEVGLKVPLIVRLEGTNVEKGKEILKTSQHTIIPADDLDDAAHKAVKSIS
ncbi:hypothetical protein WJX79_000710 [Trebouxia sp. C0005]